MDPMTASALIMGGLNFAGGLFGQNQAIKAQKALFKQQKAWEKEKMLNAYTWTMQDLEQAGLNPTLMMGGTGSANMAGSNAPGAVGVPSGNIIDPTSALKLSKEMGLIDAQKENIDADTELKGAQAGKTTEETEFQKIQNKYQDQLLGLETALKSETNREIRTNIQKTLQESSKIEKDIQKTEYEIDILKSQGKIAEAEAKTRANNRRAYAILEMTESATKSVGNVVGAVKGTSAMPMNFNTNTNSAVWHAQAGQ